jgi:DNA-binding response OmpR family regulator
MTATPSRILIIDDQMDSVALLLSYFKGQSLDILIALNGEDGLRKAIAGHPDAILLDVGMPGMDGYTVCRRLKADPRTAMIPVIFLSANTAVAHKLEGFAVGGVDYISKPFWAEEVMARLFVHLQIKQRVERLQAVGAMGEAAARDKDNDIVAATIAQVQHDEREWPGLDELARRVGINEKKLTELFRQQFGLTVFEYVAELRLENARRELAGSRLQIQLIADHAGYRNASDFSRAFRRHYGIAPRQYRQACAQATTGDHSNS